MFGIGGGIIIVPALLFIYSLSSENSPYSVHISIATSLFIVIFTGISSSISHSKNKNVIWPAAILLGLSGALSAFLFSILAINTSENVMKKILGLILFLIAIKMILDKKAKEFKEINKDQISCSKAFYIITGFIAGIFSSFSGLGGGILIVPLLQYVLKFPFSKAIGTSSAAIIFTAISGIISYNINKPTDFNPGSYYFGMSDLMYALPVIIFSVPFAHLGAIINKKTNHIILSRLFGLLLLLISFKIIFF